MHSSLKRPDISLKDVFVGSGAFAVVMLIVLSLLIAFPQITTFLVDNKFQTLWDAVRRIH